MASSDYTLTAANLREMADAIREKTGQAGLIAPNQMAAAIEAIPVGGGGKLAAVVDGSVTQITAEDLQGASIIRNYAFESCSALQSVEIPLGVTAINSYAFRYCSELETVVIPNTLESIGAYSFRSCTNLKNISFPASVESIGSYAFRSCTSLIDVTLPNTLETIGDHAFLDCSSIRSVTGMTNVISIGEGAFLNCTSLLELTVPDSVQGELSQLVFGCSSLQKLSIGAGVSSISTMFGGCESLAELYLYRQGIVNLPNAYVIEFTGLPANCAIYVPSDYVDAYKADSKWGTRANYIQAIPA